jgi:hypothetical protein
VFIAHLPAGYIASSLLFARLARHARGAVRRSRYLWAGMLGAVAPDIDLLYFYLVDHRRHPHHAYWTHYPLPWACLVLASAAWLACGRTEAAVLALVFALNGMLHLALDTVVGDIEWLAPLSHKSYALFSVPALYQPWWLNFFLHWSFALELCIVAAAFVFRRRQGTILGR